jgi:hypothetical protein
VSLPYSRRQASPVAGELDNKCCSRWYIGVDVRGGGTGAATTTTGHGRGRYTRDACIGLQGREGGYTTLRKVDHVAGRVVKYHEPGLDRNEKI